MRKVIIYLSVGGVGILLAYFALRGLTKPWYHVFEGAPVAFVSDDKRIVVLHNKEGARLWIKKFSRRNTDMFDTYSAGESVHVKQSLFYLLLIDADTRLLALIESKDSKVSNDELIISAWCLTRDGLRSDYNRRLAEALLHSNSRHATQKMASTLIEHNIQVDFLDLAIDRLVQLVVDEIIDAPKMNAIATLAGTSSWQPNRSVAIDALRNGLQSPDATIRNAALIAFFSTKIPNDSLLQSFRDFQRRTQVDQSDIDAFVVPCLEMLK